MAAGLATGPSFLNSQGVVQCGTAANPIPLGFGPGACTPWNPLAPQGYRLRTASADPNVQAFLYLPGQATSETETKSYFANITGTLFTLPAGDVGVAVGYEYRKESGFFSPDALAQTGISTDLAAGPTGGGYSLDEVYAELSIPVLADLPFAKELSISLASRYSDYDTFGDTTNSKFGFTWKPFDRAAGPRHLVRRLPRPDRGRPVRRRLAELRGLHRPVRHARSVRLPAAPPAWPTFRPVTASRRRPVASPRARIRSRRFRSCPVPTRT